MFPFRLKISSRNVNFFLYRRISKNPNFNNKESHFIMPKNRQHLKEAQRQWMKNKEKSTKYVPGKVALQVLGTGAKGAPKCLYIFSDQTRYLFNCGEGTQRLAHELKLKLSKLEHIFITNPVWQNIGGLPGISLTMQDVGVPVVNIHGPSGIQEMFDAAKKFVVLKNLKISVKESRSMDYFEDNVLKVQYIELRRDRHDDSKITNEKTSTSSQVGEDILYKRERRSRSISSSIMDENSNSSSDSSSSSTSDKYKNLEGKTKDMGTVMCYICRLQAKPGALSLEKCVTLGVPPGPLLGKLKAGQEVVLENGKVIKPEEVCDPDDPGPVFIVVDCPSEDFLPSLVNNEELKKYQRLAESDDDACLTVIHFTSKEIMEDSRYESWMESFLPSAKHVIINETNTCMGSAAVHRVQYKLNIVHPEIFPLLGDNGTQLEELEGQSELKNGVNKFYNRIQANTLTGIQLRPRKGLYKSEEVKLKPKEYIEETLSVDGVPTALQDLNAKLQTAVKKVFPTDYPRILFLGTGSCIPNKTRNTSGILLEIGNNQNILIDCGEGTYGQIVRFYGRSKSDEVLANINAIYVSHIHADHHIGIIGILQGRKAALKSLNREHKPVKLFAPVQLYPWLTFYDRYLEDIQSEYKYISNSELLHTGHQLDRENYDELIKSLNLQDINTCLVRHCPNAFGVSFVLDNGFKLTYSGDTMPCEELVLLGSESDLLIHEATMEDDLEHEAKMKMHSTTTEAIMVGKRMKAKYILLTHFSQRYSKLPIFNENFAENVGIAFDNMKVRIDDLPLLPHFNPVLKTMFVEHYDEMELKAVKRHLRQEKQNELLDDKRKIRKTQ
ncbi:ribonuclease Z, mitochondrial isoform X2 [Coccinella septempunctata]|uniref:ribonuclease Z, mitochondrial isoform X2 n=1 Tax=Coccinella septempunctata TaxID=41139 RepID=UPI001D08ADDB|nr:ribonuclease Z, mitochondrial isoform X2 [Coccinella septempunctata]